MKKFITVMISCSLALAATAMAQQDDGKQKKKEQEKGHAAQAHPAKPESVRASAKAHPGMTGAKPNANVNANNNNKAKMEAEQRNNAAKANANNKAKMEAEQRNNAAKANANNKAKMEAEQRNKANNAHNATAAQANNPNGPKRHPEAKKPDAKTIATIKQQHANFHAQPRPAQVPSVTFNNNYRIENSNHWQGERYAAFRDYHPEMHDRGWYHSHYNRVELIGGGYYYWNAGYWYPAWGYDPGAQYYAYNGPIYVGQQAEPPDKVIADVQATLQEQGYYHGDVDGLLGPLTRQALTDYQSDNGLYTTAAIDEPTLDSLGMGG